LGLSRGVLGCTFCEEKKKKRTWRNIRRNGRGLSYCGSGTFLIQRRRGGGRQSGGEAKRAGARSTVETQFALQETKRESVEGRGSSKQVKRCQRRELSRSQESKGIGVGGKARKGERLARANFERILVDNITAE